MEALILDRDFQTLCIVDAFESFIWTDRYNAPGDFEIYMPVNDIILTYGVENNYVWIEESDRLMIIEEVLITTDAENGDHITLTGRSLESILDRRVVFVRTVISDSIQNGVKQLLDENFISPDDSERQISNLRFIWNSDTRLDDLTIDLNLLGENILEILQDACEYYDLGFKILYNDDTGTFDFSLYFGEDRSYAQETNPWVVFSPGFDNLLSSDYYYSARELKTAAVIAGDQNNQYGQEVVDVDGKPSMTGLDRREMYVDGSDIETQNPEVNEDSIRERMEKRGKSETEIQKAIDDAFEEALKQTTEAYRAQLEQKGNEELAKTYITQSFEGTIEAVRQFVYGRDFFIGDVVQVRDSFGKEASSRITEVVRSHDVNGETLSPTFTTLIGGDNPGAVTE